MQARPGSRGKRRAGWAKAIFEERTSTAQARPSPAASSGRWCGIARWRPAAGAGDPRRGHQPRKDIQLRMTIRRNTDQTLPAAGWSSERFS
jgi:hypothetical protein